MSPSNATAESGRGRPSVLIVTNIVPVESRSAGEQRLLRFASILADSADVLIVARSKDVGQDRGPRSHPGGRRPYVLPLTGPRVLRVLLRLMHFDAVIFEYWHVAQEFGGVVRWLQPGARIVIDAVDLHFRRESSQAEVEGLPPPDPSVREAELRTYSQADTVVMVSDTEADLFRGLVPDGPPVVVVPIIVEPSPPQTLGSAVVFVGNFWHSPNVDGIRWFCHEIWPPVRSRVPGARLEIFGANTWQSVTDLAAVEGVKIRGYVPDPADVYRDARVAVAPLRFGAGMKGKVCEAMGRGIPVVTTAVGAEGLDLVADEHAAICDDPVGFAAALTRLLSDEQLANRQGAAGHRRIVELCGPDRVRRAAATMMPPGGRKGARSIVAAATRVAVRAAEVVSVRVASRRDGQAGFSRTRH